MNQLKTVAAVVIEHLAPLDLFGPIQAFMVAASPDPENPKGPTIPKLENTLDRESIRSPLPSEG